DPAAPSPGSPRTSSSDGPSTVDVSAVLRSPGYVRLLLLAAGLGVPVSAAAYLFPVPDGTHPASGVHRPPGPDRLRRPAAVVAAAPAARVRSARCSRHLPPARWRRPFARRRLPRRWEAAGPG